MLIRAVIALLALSATSLSGIAPAAGAEHAATEAIAPVEPGEEAPQGGGEVHSWALTPASAGVDQGGRSELSYEVEPGTDLDDAVTLHNYSNVQLTFRLYATDAFNDSDGAFVLLTGDEQPVDVGSWVSFAQDQITLPARSQATVPITLKVPVTASPGDHAGAVLASSQAAGRGPEGQVITLDRRTGSRLQVRVAGPLEPLLLVEGLRSSYQPELNPLDGSVEVRFRVVNRGNVRLGGSHDVSVAGPLGLLRRSSVSGDLPELLPGGSVEIRVMVRDVPSLILAVTNVTIQPSPIRLDGDLDPTSARSLALAFPFTPVAVTAVVGLLWWARHSYLRRRVDTPLGAAAL